MELCSLSGAPTALAGDQLITPLPQRADDDWLDDPALADRFCEFIQRLLVEVAPRLLGMRLDRCERKVGEAGACRHDAGSGLTGDIPRRHQGFLSANFPQQRAQSLT
jgi:hypothetical protein